MKNYLLVKIKTTKKTSLLLKLNRLNVDIKDISYAKDYLKFKILASDLKKVQKYLISFHVEILDETGIYKLKKELKKNNLIIIGIIFATIVFLILSNIIVKINIIHEDADLRRIISEALTDEGITAISFKKSYDEYERVIETIKKKYPDKIEWLEIDVEGMVINVRVEERIINDYEPDYSTCHIVASKSGVIKSILSQKGVAMVSINDYVTKGDILINGNITLNDEIKKSVCATGYVYAEVWYHVNASIPMTEEVRKDTGKMRYNFMIKKNTEEYVVLKSRIKGEKRVENIYLFSFFGFEFYLQKEYEVKVDYINYTEEEARTLAISLINEKLELKLDNFESINEEKVLQNTIKNNNIYIDMFVAVKEQIGVKEYFKESRSDTNDESNIKYSN